MLVDIEPIERWADKLWTEAGRSRHPGILQNDDFEARTRMLIRTNILEEAAMGLDEAIQKARRKEIAA
jgi:hypothetical protein